MNQGRLWQGGPVASILSITLPRPEYKLWGWVTEIRKFLLFVGTREVSVSLIWYESRRNVQLAIGNWQLQLHVIYKVNHQEWRGNWF